MTQIIMMAFCEKTTLSPTQSSFPLQKVLLVDEDARDLRHFTTLLGRMGYSVRAYGNHREAVACLEHGYFDLVIVSQGSPAYGTHHLVDFTIGRERYTPVVVLTSCLDISRYFEAMQLGATEYVQKPLTPAELERVVTRHCQPRQGEISSGTS
jgi:DNA-binding NtrC family response regulator